MRLFIAILFDETTKQKIQAVQERLEKFGNGNFSHPENLHLTLVFLGEIPPERLRTIERIMDNTDGAPLDLTFDHTGCFRRDGGNVWWVGLRRNQELENLHRSLCCNLLSEDFILENRRFSPHITLARQVSLSEEPDSRELMGNTFTTKADAISLMQSERINGKLTYTELYRKKLT